MWKFVSKDSPSRRPGAEPDDGDNETAWDENIRTPPETRPHVHFVTHRADEQFTREVVIHTSEPVAFQAHGAERRYV
jgi:hypothetical protein